MENCNIFSQCPECKMLFVTRKGEILDEVNFGCCRGQNGFYCSCGAELETIQISKIQLPA
jgi:hypothetical protein